MAVELALNTMNYGNAVPFARALDGLAKAGFKFVGLGASHENKRIGSGAMSDAEIRDVAKQLQERGLKANVSLCFEVHIGPDDSVAKFKRELDVMAALGIQRSIIGGPWYYKNWPTELYAPDVWKTACDQFYGCMDQILPHAEKLGVVICIKPHTGLVGHSGLVRPVLQRLKSPSLQICWDAGNVSFYEGICPDPGLDKIVPAIKSVCLKDHKGERAHPVFPPLGEGNVDHDEFFGVLAKGGFNDVLMIERLGIREGEKELTPEQVDERGAKTVGMLTPLLKKHFGARFSSH